MKLQKFPEDLPIEAVEGVTSILGTLIATLKTKDIFAESKSMVDYQETVSHIQRDLADCAAMYEAWQQEADTGELRVALEKMRAYLVEAIALANASSSRILH